MMAELDGRVLLAAMRAEPMQRPIDAVVSEDREEALWVARAQTGDQAAFRWLLARYRPNVLRLAMHVLRREGEAEDAAQEAFVRAFGSICSFRAQSRFSTWLYKIAVRVCLDKRRLARWDAESSPLVEDRAAPEAVETTGEIETRLLVEQLLSKLSPPIRAALVLREIEELEYSEIAQILGIPIGTVRSRLSAARAQFRALWAEALRENANE